MNLLEEIKKGAAFIQNTIRKNSVTNTLVGQLYLWIAELLEQLLSGNKFKGYFGDSTQLRLEHPTPMVGDTAWVGSSFPGTVWACKVDSTWYNTGAVPQTPTIDLTDYAKKKELDDLNTQLYAEGNEKFERIIIPANNIGTETTIGHTHFYTNYALFYGKYIHTVDLYVNKAGSITILFVKDISEKFLSSAIKQQYPVVAGKNTLSINRQLANNETLGFSNFADTCQLLVKKDTVNKIGGTEIYHTYNAHLDAYGVYKDVSVDLCISVTTLVPATPQGDIPKINNSIVEIKKNYAIKVNEENNKVVYAPGGKLPDNIVQVDTKTAPENSLIAKSGNGFKMMDFLALCELYGLSLTPINYFIQKLIAQGSIFDSRSIVEKYNSLDPFVVTNASAVLFPNAYTKSAVYGMNPRTGDLVPFAFSRTTSATYFDKSLNMNMASASMPRIDYGNYSDKAKILIETASTNLVTYSDLSQIVGNALLIDIDWFGYIKKGRSFIRDSYAYKDLSTILVGDKVVFSTFIIGEGGGLPVMSGASADRDIAIIIDNTAIDPSGNTKIGGLNRLFVNRTKANQSKGFGLLKYDYYSQKTGLASGYQLERRNDGVMSSYIPTEATQVTRSAESLTYILQIACSVHLKTTKQNIVLDKAAGLWNIHQDVSNEGILQIAIFDRILTASEKSQLTA